MSKENNKRGFSIFVCEITHILTIKSLYSDRKVRHHQIRDEHVKRTLNIITWTKFGRIIRKKLTDRILPYIFEEPVVIKY